MLARNHDLRLAQGPVAPDITPLDFFHYRVGGDPGHRSHVDDLVQGEVERLSDAVHRGGTGALERLQRLFDDDRRGPRRNLLESAFGQVATSLFERMQGVHHVDETEQDALELAPVRIGGGRVGLRKVESGKELIDRQGKLFTHVRRR